MNILHINSYFSTSALFSQLYERQIQDKINIDVYVPIPYDYKTDQLAAKGHYTKINRNYPRWSRWFFPLKHRLILNDLLKQYNFKDFDFVHAHSLFSNGWLALQLKKRYRIPFLVSLRNADLRTFFDRMPWMRSLGIKIIKEAEQIIFISRNTYQEVLNNYIPKDYIEDFQRKSNIIPNGIDHYWHQHKNNQPVPSIHQPIKIVVTSKILASKRLINLANLVDDYSKTYQPSELHIIGPTWEDNVLTKLKSFSFVKYHGPKNKAEMVDLYRQMDIFAMLSYPETFGLVYVEAMSQGLPVIYTSGEGFDNFFPNKYVGVSVHPKNQEAFNEAVNYIIDGENYRKLQTNALNSIKEFNWDDIHFDYLKLYQHIYNNKNKISS